MAYVILTILAVYAVIGALFGVWFVARGVDRLDSAAHGASWRFRVLIWPGTVAFWPYLAIRVRRRGQTGGHV